VWPAACRAGLGLRGTAQRLNARRSGHRSPGALCGVAGGGATVVEVEQTTALEHPWRRGYPPGVGVEAIGHRSSLSTGRGRKTGSTAVFSDEAMAPVVGGGPAIERRRVSGGGGVEMTTAPGGTAHQARCRPAMAASARRSDSSGGEPWIAGRRLRTGRAC
jgi:hypothetical protein